ncbi:MAG: hypothetical protein BMS9Abin37_1749 [Acidobacteriota bacterium]|nr:MAG: hypothetical protein BMS9Abin37_1749 [Acidobacteriota bacterium]
MCALSQELSSEPGPESGLSIDEIEARLSAAAIHHHLEERNIAYWLLEIEERRLHKERGFSSIGDSAMELVGIKPRKAQYLVFIASRLEKLPKIRAAFDSGELSWTKAREITGVATAETEAEWLEKARALSNRDLEREARRHAGQDSGAFATVTISMPVEVLAMWNDAYELAERVSGTELEKWQVLEPSLAEFLGTHLPSAAPGEGGEGIEIDDEKELPYAVRQAVFDRDRWQCKFPGCTMRKMLDVHHIVFRSRGGSDDICNLVCLCRVHHGLVHRGICKVTGSVGVDLEFDRPHLFTEPKPVAVEEEPVVEDAIEQVSPPTTMTTTKTTKAGATKSSPTSSIVRLRPNLLSPMQWRTRISSGSGSTRSKRAIVKTEHGGGGLLAHTCARRARPESPTKPPLRR